MRITISVPPSDVVDKIAILEVKLVNIRAPKKRAAVKREYHALKKVFATLPRSRILNSLRKQLIELHVRQWRLEDQTRVLLKTRKFKAAALAAQKVHRSNDERNALKRLIDRHLGAEFSDEKQYA